MGRSVIRQLVQAKSTHKVTLLALLAAFFALPVYGDELTADAAEAIAAEFLAALKRADAHAVDSLLAPDAEGKFWIESDRLTVWQTIGRDELLREAPTLEVWRCPFKLAGIEPRQSPEPVFAEYTCQEQFASKRFETTVLGVRFYFTINRCEAKVENLWLEWKVPDDVRLPLEP